MVGQRFLDVELMRAGLLDAEHEFSELRHTKESNAAIVNLFFGQVDAALVTNSSYLQASKLNNQISDALQVILISQPLTKLLASIHKDFPPQIIENLIPYSHVLNESPRLRQLKDSILFGGVTKLKTEDMIAINKLNMEYLELKNRRSRE
jgi:ABC-type phosphate/phosphonate transport system substrate-binding protein